MGNATGQLAPPLPSEGLAQGALQRAAVRPLIFLQLSITAFNSRVARLPPGSQVFLEAAAMTAPACFSSLISHE